MQGLGNRLKVGDPVAPPGIAEPIGGHVLVRVLDAAMWRGHPAVPTDQRVPVVPMTPERAVADDPLKHTPEGQGGWPTAPNTKRAYSIKRGAT